MKLKALFLKAADIFLLITVVTGCCNGIPGASGPECIDGKKIYPKFVLNYDSLNGGFRIEDIDTILLIRYYNQDSAFNAPIDTMHYYYGFLSGTFGTEFGKESGSKEDYVMEYSYLIRGKNLDKDYRIRDIQMSVTDKSTKCCEAINETLVSYRLNETQLLHDQYILINKK